MAAYVLHIDGKVPAGWYQNFKTGINRRWRLRGVQFQLTAAELVAHKAAVKAQYAKRKAEEEKRHSEAAARAFALIKATRKRPMIIPISSARASRHRRASRSRLIQCRFPTTASRRQMRSSCRFKMPTVSFALLRSSIPPTATARPTKTSSSAGAWHGTYFVIGGTDANEAHIDPQGLSLMAEGVATGGSVFEVMNVPTIVAFNGGNLLPVAKAIQDRYRKARFGFAVTMTGRRRAIQAANMRWKRQPRLTRLSASLNGSQAASAITNRPISMICIGPRDTPQSRIASRRRNLPKKRRQGRRKKSSRLLLKRSRGSTRAFSNSRRWTIPTSN